MTDLRENTAVVHVRFDGKSYDIPLTALELGLVPGDEAVKRAVACFLDVGEARLSDYVVDRHHTGNLTVRPEAVFG